MDAWYMDNSDEDQRLPHKLDPNQPVSLEELQKIGVFYWRVGSKLVKTELTKAK